jgi:hypothetical protein
MVAMTFFRVEDVELAVEVKVKIEKWKFYLNSGEGAR